MKRGHESGYAKIEGSLVATLISDRHSEIVELSYKTLNDFLLQLGIETTESKDYFGDYVRDKIRIYFNLGIISISFNPGNISEKRKKFAGMKVTCLINYNSLTKVGIIVGGNSSGNDHSCKFYFYDDCVGEDNKVFASVLSLE